MERNIISLGIRVEIYIFFNWNGGNRSLVLSKVKSKFVSGKIREFQTSSLHSLNGLWSSAIIESEKSNSRV